MVTRSFVIPPRIPATCREEALEGMGKLSHRLVKLLPEAVTKNIFRILQICLPLDAVSNHLLH